MHLPGTTPLLSRFLSFFPFSLSSFLCSSFLYPLLALRSLSRTSRRLVCRAFYVLSDGALLTRILPRNYQEEEIVGRRYVVKRLDLEWKEKEPASTDEFYDFRERASERLTHNVTLLGGYFRYITFNLKSTEWSENNIFFRIVSFFTLHFPFFIVFPIARLHHFAALFSPTYTLFSTTFAFNCPQGFFYITGSAKKLFSFCIAFNIVRAFHRFARKWVLDIFTFIIFINITNYLYRW